MPRDEYPMADWGWEDPEIIEWDSEDDDEMSGERQCRPREGFCRPREGFCRPREGFCRPREGFCRPREGFCFPR